MAHDSSFKPTPASRRGLIQALSCMRLSLQLIAVLAISTVLAGCNSCENEISQTVASPSGKLKVVMFNRNCGATTGFNTQVSIISATATLPNNAGNTLIIDGTVPLRAQWHLDSALHLAGLGSAKVFKQENSVAGVSVSYGN
ncbi:MAG: hypothetical protein LBL72_11080 [Candidatus Accumulibacter sp.]|jgi:hypothetical protein|nr:hypothetical protein [Accumulibacter sp.]